MRRAIMLTAVAFATPASAADPYDLACSSKTSNVRYHIDIDQGKWCADECKNVQAIAKVTSEAIFLVKHRVLFTNRPRGEIRISTDTGAWYLFKTYPYRNDPLIINGTCKREPLTKLGANS